jgi:tetratricopeptide (TPR) repeat protein
MPYHQNHIARLFCISLFIFFNLYSFSQNPGHRRDSLLKILKSGQTDTSEIKTLNALAFYYAYENYDSAFLFANRARTLSDETKYANGIAEAELWIGTTLLNSGKPDEALTHLIKTSGLSSDKKILARALTNIGVVYNSKSDFPRALNYYYKALKIEEAIGNKPGIARNLGNIGSIHTSQGNYPHALEMYNKALALSSSTHDKTRMAIHYGNIANVYTLMLDYKNAIQFTEKALELRTQLNNKNGIALSYTTMGSIYYIKKDYSMALEYYSKALKLDGELGNENKLAMNYGNIGLVYMKTGKFAVAEKHLKEALKISIDLKALDGQKIHYKYLSQFYDTIGNFKYALENYRKFIELRDQLLSEENTKKTIQQEMQYQFDKKTAADSIKNAENKKLEKLKHDQELSKQKTFTWSGIAGFLIMIVIAFISVRAYKTKHRANIEIARQKTLVDIKQKEILDSIQYAKRIQTALITSETYIEKHLSALKNKYRRIGKDNS